jgi:hypothetical protein
MVKASFPNWKKLVNVDDMSTEKQQLDEVSGAGDSVPESSEAAEAIPGAAPGKALSPEAVRALLEADARRQAAQVAPLPPEINGRREGEEPTRYGDWEKKGLAVDF